MSKIYEDNSLTIGHTPLVRLNRIGNGRILAKVESRNPSFSVKCRIGANMIWDAEKRGILTPAKNWLNRPAQHRHRAGLCRRGARL
ncbi:Cysteine synthase A [Serratia rubidaea]|uniref:cysteine synthase n=1 Tax=Serratia rubidaea TaxID=61652 RepID=A0A4U9HSM4_SERRU|nr:Cysteine synthase A [Serratia rubidaea]